MTAFRASAACPTATVLHEWLLGRLTADVADDVAQHLDDCHLCVTQLDAMTDAPELKPVQTARPNFSTPTSKAILSDARLDSIKRAVQASTQTTAMPASGQASDTARLAYTAPTSIEHFQLSDQLGEGAFGSVYSAWDTKLNRRVALKILRADRLGPRITERFVREVQSLGQIKSPHVVQIYEVSETHDGVPYYAMELITGGTVAAWFEKQVGSGTPDEQTMRAAVELVRDAAIGLEAVHRAGLVHRDIKPSNLLICAETGSAKLTDFGLVGADQFVTVTQADEMLGTPAYMSPEQVQGGHIDRRSDIYSLGATLYQLITGQLLFHGATHAVLNQIMEREPTAPRLYNPNISVDLESICLKAIDKRPSQRYASSEALRVDLEHYLQGLPVTAKPLTRRQRVSRWCLRNRALAAALLGLLIVLVSGTIVSTAMWLASERHAAEAVSTADALRSNRALLRETVARFQHQVLSNDALFWQMAPSFRSQMFREFITYLDQFAELDSDSNTSPHGDTSLAQDYVDIANCAVTVRDWSAAKDASERALKRLRAIDDQQVDDLRRHSKAAALLATALNKIDSETNTSPLSEQISQLYDESLAMAERARALSPADPFVQLDLLSAKRAALENSSIHDSVPELRELYAAFRQATETAPKSDYREVSRLALPAGVEVGLALADRLDTPENIEILTQNEALISAWNEIERSSQRPLYVCNHLRGTNYAKLATLHAQNEDWAAAIEVGTLGLARYTQAVTDNPQNFEWQAELADLEVHISDWYRATEQLDAADQMLASGLRHSISLLRNDPHHEPYRVVVIELFIKKAELSEQRRLPDQAAQERYYAAQDCRYFVGDAQHPLSQHYFELRLWLLSQIVQHLDNATPSTFSSNFRNWESNYQRTLATQRSDLDAAKMLRVLNGEERIVSRE
ncbi:MAG: serine/threonine protein kinase [Planctomycetales bacterium]|nr:serine/threonine protein kinase [Planctomycetales bacterium]